MKFSARRHLARDVDPFSKNCEILRVACKIENPTSLELLQKAVTPGDHPRRRRIELG